MYTGFSPRHERQRHLASCRRSQPRLAEGIPVPAPATGTPLKDHSHGKGDICEPGGRGDCWRTWRDERIVTPHAHLESRKAQRCRFPRGAAQASQTRRRLSEGGRGGCSDDYSQFQEWMVYLHPDQKRVAETDFDRPVVLTGVSGSGKTCVLIHRARYLAKKYPTERIGILTLNRSEPVAAHPIST